MESKYQQGQIWYAYIPFTDGPFPENQDETGKFRPVVIVGWTNMGKDEDENILVVPITSVKNSHKTIKNGEFRISDLDQAGLTKDSTVQARRLVAINPSSMGKYKGRITDKEIMLIIKELGMMLRLPEL